MSGRSVLDDAWKLLSVAVFVFAVVAGALLLLSEGEPVCEGPLILDVDDSDPPQCDSPLDGLIEQSVPLIVGSVLLAAVLRVVFVLATSRRQAASEA